MYYKLSAACGCSTGRTRKNNEDNFYFNGHILNERNNGLDTVASMECSKIEGTCFCVFDGMGGEEYGELASFAAASTLKANMREFDGNTQISNSWLENLCEAMNDAVCARAEELSSRSMGTTMAMLCFSSDKVHACNIGDSRIYLLRDHKLFMLSEEHVEVRPPGSRKRKPGLTQYLGVFKDELLLEPYIAVCEIQENDVYLICSDGLTDMLTGDEIYSCMKQRNSAKRTVDHLISQANRNGGHDNITALIVKIQ